MIPIAQSRIEGHRNQTPFEIIEEQIVAPIQRSESGLKDSTDQGTALERQSGVPNKVDLCFDRYRYSLTTSFLLPPRHRLVEERRDFLLGILLSGSDLLVRLRIEGLSNRRQRIFVSRGERCHSLVASFFLYTSK